MSKPWMRLLEKAYAAEVNGALGGYSRIMQTRATKLAGDLVAAGYLRAVEESIGRVTIKGYDLTELGRLTYCMSCIEEPTP